MQCLAIKTGDLPVIQQPCVVFLKELNGWSIPRKYVQYDPKTTLIASDRCHMRKQTVPNLLSPKLGTNEKIFQEYPASLERGIAMVKESDSLVLNLFDYAVPSAHSACKPTHVIVR